MTEEQAIQVVHALAEWTVEGGTSPRDAEVEAARQTALLRALKVLAADAA